MRLATRRQRGIALVITLLTMVVVAGIGTLLFARTVNEIRHSGDDSAIVQTLLLARAGANLGGALLSSDIRDELNQIVNVRSSTTTCWSFGSGSCTEPTPTPSTVVSALTGSNSVATLLQARVDSLLCSADAAAFGAGSEVRIRVYVTDTSCGQPLPPSITLPEGRFVSGQPRPKDQDYSIPFVMVSEATLGDYQRNVVLQGEYRFTVGRVTFAQYALFTNHHTINAGGTTTPVWFTDRTLFDGPVHTNEYFRFFRNPWFGHRVTTAGCPSNRRQIVSGVETCTSATAGAFFNDQPNTLRTGLGPNPSFGANPPHRPEFTAHGVDWSSAFVPLPRNNYEQATVAGESGLHFGRLPQFTSLYMWAGNSSAQPMNCNAGTGVCTPASTHQYIEATYRPCTALNWNGTSCSTRGAERTELYRFDASGRLERRVSTSPVVWQVVTSQTGQPVNNFNGVIYVEGSVPRVGGPARATWANPNTAAPAIASFAQMTLAIDGSAEITRDIKYERPTCSSSPQRQANGTVTPATCTDLDALNVLGMYTQTGNISIANTGNTTQSADNAPNDIHIHGVYMSSEGEINVENYNAGVPRGTVHLLGGIIENRYGAFGQFDNRTGDEVSGYNRNFTYDQRMYASVSPPYFPTIGLDRVKNVSVFSFGQREQVY